MSERRSVDATQRLKMNESGRQLKKSSGDKSSNVAKRQRSRGKRTVNKRLRPKPRRTPRGKPRLRRQSRQGRLPQLYGHSQMGLPTSAWLWADPLLSRTSQPGHHPEWHPTCIGLRKTLADQSTPCYRTVPKLAPNAPSQMATTITKPRDSHPEEVRHTKLRMLSDAEPVTTTKTSLRRVTRRTSRDHLCDHLVPLRR